MDLFCIQLKWENIKENEVEVWVDNFLQIAVFCPPKPRAAALVSRNVGKVYLFAQACTLSHVQYLMVFFPQDIFPDKASERRILSYLVRCPCPGCQWTGELREVQVKLH